MCSQHVETCDCVNAHARIKYFSPFKYAFNIVARNEFEGLTFTCDPDPTEACTPSTWPSGLVCYLSLS
jgi:hypothetical protein